MNVPMVRLTSLAHGGGCGCKLAPSVLQQLLADQPLAAPYRQLLVGTETGDDAAVWQLDDDTCVIATTDFFMPMVDDPSISAASPRPTPSPMSTPWAASRSWRWPSSACRSTRSRRRSCAKSSKAAPPSARRPAFRSRADTRSTRPSRSMGSPSSASARRRRATQLRRQAGRRPHPHQADRRRHLFGGDQEGRARGAGYAEMIASTTLLNRIGVELAKDAAVHAVTDVTGFGLLGHGLEMARGSGAVAGHSRCRSAAAVAGGLSRNRVSSPALRTATGRATARSCAAGGLPEWRRHLLTDPQTSGGLLVACAPDAPNACSRAIIGAGYPRARIIGAAEVGPPKIRVTAA